MTVGVLDPSQFTIDVGASNKSDRLIYNDLNGDLFFDIDGINAAKQVQEFTKSHKQVIAKPVYGGAHARSVTQSQLDLDRISSALRLAPVTLQEYIPGTNIRTYAIANSVYAAEICSNSLDFREDSEAELIPIDLSESLRKQCLAIAKALHLEWTAIDWRKTPAGEYIFLEANPSPMFIHFEAQTGFPITQELVKLLLA